MEQKQVLYKGKLVPAKFIDIGNGQKKLIPANVNRYVLYGAPLPTKLEITNVVKIAAVRIIECNRNTLKGNKVLLVKYIRKGKDGYILCNRAKSEDTIEYFIGRGEPYGAAVSFVNDGELRIGWSKRLEGEMYQQKEAIQLGAWIQKEPLVFTKKDAVCIAVMRGLVDSIIFRGSGAYTNTDEVIPKAIAKILWPFIERSQSYFKRDAVNVTI